MAQGQSREQQLPPGSLSLPAVPFRLEAVVSSSVVVCAFDMRRQRGGMAHYCRPYREKKMPSTARYAGPAIVGLIRKLEQEGSRPGDVSVHLLGGAFNESVAGFEKGLAEENVKVGLEILGKLGLSRVGMDTGGTQARRVLFDTATGKVSMSKVEQLGAGYWYPCPGHLLRSR